MSNMVVKLHLIIRNDDTCFAVYIMLLRVIVVFTGTR